MKMNTRKMVLSAFFLALGMLMPSLTMHIPVIGSMLLPMHIPVLLCGFICGGPYGAIIGFVLPLINSVLFGAPPMMPTAIAMAFELMCYGLIAGLLYAKFKNYKFGIYLALIPTMLIGRVVWGIAAFILYNILGNAFTIQIFFASAFTNAIIGIIIQLILIPVIVISLKKTNVEVFLNGSREVSNKSGV